MAEVAGLSVGIKLERDGTTYGLAVDLYAGIAEHHAAPADLPQIAVSRRDAVRMAQRLNDLVFGYDAALAGITSDTAPEDEKRIWGELRAARVAEQLGGC